MCLRNISQRLFPWVRNSEWAAAAVQLHTQFSCTRQCCVHDCHSTLENEKLRRLLVSIMEVLPPCISSYNGILKEAKTKGRWKLLNCQNWEENVLSLDHHTLKPLLHLTPRTICLHWTCHPRFHIAFLTPSTKAGLLVLGTFRMWGKKWNNWCQLMDQANNFELAFVSCKKPNHALFTAHICS